MKTKGRDLPVAMTVAGSDSGAGAGIQADLLTFAALGVFGTTAITCLTAQNPDGVCAVQAATSEFVRAQMEQIATYFHPAAMKTGMLYDAEIIGAVCAFLEVHREIPVVVDPVMISTSGASLLRDDAVTVMCGRLMPLATIITPNLDEAAAILGHRVRSVADMRNDARMLHAVTGANVLLKGGHLDLPGRVTDVLYTREGLTLEFSDERVENVNTHGSGCTLSAALAAQLALGRSVEDAVVNARKYLLDGMRSGVRVSGSRFISHVPKRASL